MAKKKKKAAKKKTLNAGKRKFPAAKPSGWMRATHVKFLKRKGGGLDVLIRRPRKKKARRK